MYVFISSSIKDSTIHEYFHTEKFTKKQFETIVLHICLKVYSEMVKEEINSYYKIKWDYIISDHRFVEELKKQGFKKVKYQETFNIFSWMDSSNPDDWKDWSTINDIRITKRFRKMLIREGLPVTPLKNEGKQNNN